MPPKIKAKSKWKIAGEARRSQVVSTYGPGAIVDFPRISGIMAGLDEWDIYDVSLPLEARFRERNLEKMLGKSFFVQVSSDERFENSFAIPMYRFPRYYYCPECHTLDRYTAIAKNYGDSGEYNKVLYCSNEKCRKNGKPVRLIPSRFIVACKNGHIDDFPYYGWVHRRHKGSGEQHKLFLEYKGNTGGLDSIQIRCSCGAVETMAGCMDKDALSFMKCTGTMPWLGLNAEKKPWYKDPENCNATMRTIQRSANNVYYPVNQSALTIPPWSSKVQQVLRKYEEALLDIFDQDEETIERSLKKHYSRRQKEYRCSEATFLKEAFRYFRDEDDTEITEETLRTSEYTAFCDNDYDKPEDYFKTKNSDVPDEIEEYIESIKIVSRLREVKVLKGFRRIVPSSEQDAAIRAMEGLNDREFSPISKEPLDWLPAIQMFGEGIFIKLQEDAVKAWEERVGDRYRRLAESIRQPWVGNNMFNVQKPRYILLHTLAHILIKQLTIQCGYVSASLKEKIYSTFNGSDEEMCGLLIYTSSTDSDGSLGGLSREGDGVKIGNTLLNALEEATWCSNDPICMDSNGQGYDSLNLAACHACALLPETSCEANNCLLDRVALVGKPENRELGFFSDLL